MRKFFRALALGPLALACLVHLHCGGEATSTAFAQEEDVGEEAEVSSGSKSVAITGAGGDVAVDAGYAANGTTIEVPAGFTAAQCKFTASLATLDGSAISTQVSVNTETGEVVCEKVVQEREQVPPEVQDCTAAFMVVCAK